MLQKHIWCQEKAVNGFSVASIKENGSIHGLKLPPVSMLNYMAIGLLVHFMDKSIGYKRLKCHTDRVPFS
jgi:hypothetical protein